MSNLVFIFEAFNPNKRTTFFKHKNYTNYLAYSEYAIKNVNVNHGLFGKVQGFNDIENMDNIEKVNQYITKLADDKVPIYRCTISLTEYDAVRLGYDNKEAWKELFESKLVSFANKMNIKYEDLQYAGAVHLEDGHPHLQVMMWSKQRDKMNYFIKYNRINKMKDEFTNAVFRDDLLELYKEKDLAKKSIISDNEILKKFKLVSNDKKFLKDMLQYEKDLKGKKIIKRSIKDKDLQSIVDDILKIRNMLRETTGSIKYQYLKRYPDVIREIDNLSKKIIDSSLDTREQVDKYILAKQKIVEFKYSNDDKIKEAQQLEKEKAEEEILKMIGNQILNFERTLLFNYEEYTPVKYKNLTTDFIWQIFNAIYFSSRQEEMNIRQYEMKYKKQLSKQAKIDKAINKANSSNFDWEH